jgi:hypothetical protein
VRPVMALAANGKPSGFVEVVASKSSGFVVYVVGLLGVADFTGGLVEQESGTARGVDFEFCGTLGGDLAE